MIIFDFSKKYYTKELKKKSGGIRLIKPPSINLKKVQRLILDKILYKYKNLECVYGLSKDKGVVANANFHKKNFDNMKVCSMSEGDLWVFLINGRYSVSVGSDHYPRSKGGLRIDNSPAIYGYEGELPKPLSIIERLKKGKVAYTRYQEWPYEYDKDGEVSLKNFTKQFNEMLKQYKNL